MSHLETLHIITEVLRSYGAEFRNSKTSVSADLRAPDAERVLDDLSMRDLGSTFFVYRQGSRIEASWGARGLAMQEAL